MDVCIYNPELFLRSAGILNQHVGNFEWLLWDSRVKVESAPLRELHNKLNTIKPREAGLSTKGCWSEYEHLLQKHDREEQMKLSPARK